MKPGRSGGVARWGSPARCRPRSEGRVQRDVPGGARSIGVQSAAMDEPSASGEPSSDFGREWNEILNEIRVALPGVQLLFGFLLTAPFTDAFRAMSEANRSGYFICFLNTTLSTAFLIAPSVYHRLHWRRDVRDKELMLRTCNGLAIIGIVFLALAMTSAVYVVTAALAGRVVGALVGCAAGLLFAVLWFALPALRRSVERQRSTG